MYNIPKKNRNLLIDYLRALTIIYIICWIHLLYWWHPERTILKSWFLGEMIIIFFLMGASYTSSSQKKYRYYLAIRLQRIYIPYFVYAIALCIYVVAYHYIRYNEISSHLVISNFTHWINPFKMFNLKGNIAIIPFVSWHLWFIPTAIVVIPFIPLAHQFASNVKKYITLIMIMTILLSLISIYDEYFLINLPDPLIYFDYILFYLIIVCLGFKFNELQAGKPWIKILSIFILLIVIFLLNRFLGLSLDMQENKFPPNIIYLLFGFIWIMTISLFICKLHNINKSSYIKKYLLWFSKYSYTAYLYHPFAYLLLFYLKTEIYKPLNIEFINKMTIPFFILFLVSFLIFIFGRIERIVFFEPRLREMSNSKFTKIS